MSNSKAYAQTWIAVLEMVLNPVIPHGRCCMHTGWCLHVQQLATSRQEKNQQNLWSRERQQFCWRHGVYWTSKIIVMQSLSSSEKKICLQDSPNCTRMSCDRKEDPPCLPCNKFYWYENAITAWLLSYI